MFMMLSVIMAEPLREFTRLIFDECRMAPSAKPPPTQDRARRLACTGCRVYIHHHGSIHVGYAKIEYEYVSVRTYVRIFQKACNTYLR